MLTIRRWRTYFGFGRVRKGALKALPAQMQRGRPGHLPLPLGKAARFACTIAPPPRGRVEAAPLPASLSPSSQFPQRAPRIRDRRPVFERMPAAAVVAIFEELMHSCRNIPDRVARRQSYTLGIPGLAAVCIRSGLTFFPFAGKTCELKPNYRCLRRSMRGRASTNTFSGNAG